jgi:CxxC motif-containing protein
MRARPKEGGGWTVEGNTCPRGAAYAIQEMEAPVRTVTSTVRVAGGAAPLCAVKTAGEVPKASIPACLEAVRAAVATAPVAVGDVIVADVAGTGVALVATASVGAR